MAKNKINIISEENIFTIEWIKVKRFLRLTKGTNELAMTSVVCCLSTPSKLPITQTFVHGIQTYIYKNQHIRDLST